MKSTIIFVLIIIAIVHVCSQPLQEHEINRYTVKLVDLETYIILYKSDLRAMNDADTSLPGKIDESFTMVKSYAPMMKELHGRTTTDTPFVNYLGYVVTDADTLLQLCRLKADAYNQHYSSSGTGKIIKFIFDCAGDIFNCLMELVERKK